MPEVILVNKLIQNNFTISFAESCTGGLCASKIVNVPNASNVFNTSFITYSNQSKIEILGVDANTIEEYGVVSEEVACLMASGCAKKAKSNIGVGISGIAGPTGGTPNKPVGMVCFGFWINGQTFSKTLNFGEIGRQNVRNLSCEFVLNFLIEKL